MADIRCPMCGKPNPEDLEICQFCQARLKPLRLTSQQDEGQPNDSTLSEAVQPQEPKGDQDWLGQMRLGADLDDTPDPEPEAPFHQDDEPEDGKDDWLQRIRSLHQADQDDTIGTESSQDAASTSSWGDENQHRDDDDLPDWFGRLQGQGSHPEDGASPEPTGAADAFPDWLKDTGSVNEPDTPPDEEAGEAFPDWLKAGLDASQADQAIDVTGERWSEPSTTSEERDSFEDFLSSLENLEAIEKGTPFPQTPGTESFPDNEGEDLAAWISDEFEEPLEAPTSAQDKQEERDDWFSEISAAEPEIQTSSQGQPEEIPDWLADLGIGSDIDQDQPTAPQPDWLEGAIIEENLAAPSFPGQEQAPPDWLVEATTGSQEDELEDSFGFDRARNAEIFDEPSILEPIEPPVYRRPGDHTPEWLRNLDSEDDQTGEAGQEEDIIPTGEEDLQSWFSELDQEGTPEAEPEPGSSADEMPGWLKNLGSVVTGTVEDNTLPDFSSEDSTPFIGQEEFDDDLLDVESLPSWLTPESIAAEEEKDESGLAAAELPGWLEAMRPVEPSESGTPIENGPVENAGPLAGLRAILPAEPEVNRYTKPPVYSAKLRVTESQIAQADLIQKVLAGEGQTLPIPEPPLVSSQRALRWLTALILSIVIGFVVIGRSQFVPLPAQGAIPASTTDTSRVITALPDQARVLIAFDYEPGTAGEMHAAAAALVDHLMLKAARLTLVSTLTTGPAVAEYFIQVVQSQHHYASGNQYINLGYIPGGATGLQSFAQNPRWLFPQSYEGFSPWETVPLQGIESLADYDLVVVISDDSDTARLWIEQVQPLLQETPLLAVLSARAEPLVRPYYGDTPDAQVKGIVTGISGGAAYEVLVGRANLGRTYWDAFAVGLVVAIAAILIGGIVSLAQIYLVRRHGESRGEEK
jgi:hypothetical protein